MLKIIYSCFLFYLLISIKASLAEGKDTLPLLSQYRSLHPFYNSIREPMPVQKCEKITRKKSKTQPAENCWVEIQYEDNPDRMLDLLERTESAHSAADPDFLSTELGREYSNLKRFMDIYKKAQSCRQGQAENNAVHSHLSRIQWNISADFNINESCLDSNANTTGIEAFLQNRDFISLPEESNFQRLLFSDIVKKSIRARILMESQTQERPKEGKNLAAQIVQEICQGTRDASVRTARGTRYRSQKMCDPKDKDFLAQTVEEMEAHTPPSGGRINVQHRVNQELLEVNSILQSYNEERKKIVEEAQEELSKLPSNITKRSRAHQIQSQSRQKLQRLKAGVFRRYHTKLSEIYSTDIGSFFSTSAVQESTGLLDLDKITAKGLGLAGFEQDVLTNTSPFPLLKPIDSNTSQTAVDEFAGRIQTSLQNALIQNKDRQREDQEHLSQAALHAEGVKNKYREQRMEDIENLIMIHPGSLSSVLKNHPEYFSIVCSALKNIASDERKRAILKKSLIYLGSAGALAISLIAPVVGFSGIPVFLAVAGAAAAVSTADYSFRSSEANRHYELREDILNAYLAQTGDAGSIEDIRREWKNFLSEDIHSKWAVGLGVFDLTRAGFAMRSSLRTAVKSLDLPKNLNSSSKLLQAISANGEYRRVFVRLVQNHPKDQVERFLSTISFFPKPRQQVILDNLSKVVLNPELNLSVLTDALKSSARISGIKTVLKRAASCVSCKVSSTIRKVKE